MEKIDQLFALGQEVKGLEEKILETGRFMLEEERLELLKAYTEARVKDFECLQYFLQQGGKVNFDSLSKKPKIEDPDYVKRMKNAS